MSGANVTCANCFRVFWHEDDAAQERAFRTHNCAETRRTQTLTNYSRVTDEQWAEFQASCNYPSSFGSGDAA
jgi:hypothetical protein